MIYVIFTIADYYRINTRRGKFVSLDVIYSEHLSTGLSQLHPVESIQANNTSEESFLHRAFEESAQFLKLTEAEIELGKRFLKAFETESFESVQNFMSFSLVEPGSKETRRVFMAICAALGQNGISARYEVINCLDSAYSPQFGQFSIDCLDGEHTLNVSSFDMLSFMDGPDRNKNPDEFFSI